MKQRRHKTEVYEQVNNNLPFLLSTDIEEDLELDNQMILGESPLSHLQQRSE